MNGKYGLRLAEVDHVVALLDPLDHAGDDLALLVLVLVVDDVALGVPHLLHDDLFGRLGRDPAERRGVHLYADAVAYDALGVMLFRVLGGYLHVVVFHVFDDRLEPEDLYLSDLGVILGLEVKVVSEFLLGCRKDSFFERLYDDLLRDPFFFPHLLYDVIQVKIHIAPLIAQILDLPSL